MKSRMHRSDVLGYFIIFIKLLEGDEFIEPILHVISKVTVEVILKVQNQES